MRNIKRILDGKPQRIRLSGIGSIVLLVNEDHQKKKVLVAW